ncbi:MULTISPECIES: MarR family winged helix-turn-helix transcriptional regulator [unclassified Pseudomonas]|uniref:MarR family winged helix-turn-helix transcriptional regulator n=1 Tax=unclassified Pseudomonas TaxID=196821 RepID=UPI0024494ED2|nr:MULTISPECIES: MarR family winged helix-turn-helix transcriptional regulator [unclassified Pseudomonas]MDG9922605.1 MarR family winged helix-turn-helix transcriptional regulator [Pseudomonas sp. GD04045]MDH0033262.1 MarR family winged helix-turn-helix transcriptional regulator [Pseudomonas sp. GD04019]
MTGTTLFDLLERLTSLMRVWNRQHPLLAELQPIQVSALVYLARCNRYSNTPLAVTEYLGLTKGTVSQSLKALEAKGLIEKSQDPRDRRSVHLRLTAPALALVEAITPPDFLVTALAQMGERAVELEALFGNLLRQIQRNQDVPGFGLCSTCRFHQQRDGAPFCGLTEEPLMREEVGLICREHQPPAAA